ncbi:four helix bundle protein [Candidatus Falkowbacteria bacterium]|nr:four helix bundle protein [Candidatus Falkowbacteria bacterium]
MSNQAPNQNNKNKYDLIERTAKFGEDIIEFCKSLINTPINRPLVSQLVRSGTSIGANYMEADCAESKKDFRHKIGICKKESKETTHWLRMIAKANQDKKDECRKLWKEAHEFTLIFSAIINKSKVN